MMNAEMFAAGAACAQGAACWVPLAVAAGVGTAVGFVAGLAVGKKSGKGAARPAAAKRASAPAPRRDLRPTETRVAIPPTSVEIYVGNLSYDLDEAGLRKMFEKFGAVSTARIVTNRYNNKSKGFGFVVMPNRPEAEKAIAEYDEKEFMGRKMKVNEARNTLKSED